MLQRFPWALCLVSTWMFARYLGFDLSMTGVLVWVFVALSIITIIVEFYRSGDIMLRSFQIEQTLAILATLLLGFGLWLVYQDPHLVDALVIVSVLADAIISPINSFRTALRNMQAGVNTMPVDVHH